MPTRQASENRMGAMHVWRSSIQRGGEARWRVRWRTCSMRRSCPQVLPGPEKGHGRELCLLRRSGKTIDAIGGLDGADKDGVRYAGDVGDSVEHMV